MTNQHPITPPIDLVRQWSDSSPIQYEDELWAYELFIARQAARWGADRELEACCQGLENQTLCGERDAKDKERTYSIVRRALEQLDRSYSSLLDALHFLGLK